MTTERGKDYNKQWCLRNREHIKEYNKRWYQEHKEARRGQVNRNSKAYRERVRLEVLTYYGRGRCACVKCGFTDIGALSIDHIDNSGASYRRTLHNFSIYSWLKKEGYPEGYQTLCMNCQWIKERRRRGVEGRQRKG